MFGIETLLMIHVILMHSYNIQTLSAKLGHTDRTSYTWASFLKNKERGWNKIISLKAIFKVDPARNHLRA